MHPFRIAPLLLGINYLELVPNTLFRIIWVDSGSSAAMSSLFCSSLSHGNFGGGRARVVAALHPVPRDATLVLRRPLIAVGIMGRSPRALRSFPFLRSISYCEYKYIGRNRILSAPHQTDVALVRAGVHFKMFPRLLAQLRSSVGSPIIWPWDTMPSGACHLFPIVVDTHRV